MANISIYSRTTKQRTSDFLILIHTRDKSQPRLLMLESSELLSVDVKSKDSFMIVICLEGLGKFQNLLNFWSKFGVNNKKSAS